LEEDAGYAGPLGNKALALNGDESGGLADGPPGNGDASALGDGFEGRAVGPDEFGGDAEGAGEGTDVWAADGVAFGVEVVPRGSVSDFQRLCNPADGVRAASPPGPTNRKRVAASRLLLTRSGNGLRKPVVGTRKVNRNRRPTLPLTRLKPAEAVSVRVTVRVMLPVVYCLAAAGMVVKFPGTVPELTATETSQPKRTPSGTTTLI